MKKSEGKEIDVEPLAYCIRNHIKASREALWFWIVKKATFWRQSKKRQQKGKQRQHWDFVRVEWMDETSIEKSGYMSYPGQMKSTSSDMSKLAWKSYYFILHSNLTLEYRESADSKTIIKSIHLQNIDVRVSRENYCHLTNKRFPVQQRVCESNNIWDSYAQMFLSLQMWVTERV